MAFFLNQEPYIFRAQFGKITVRLCGEDFQVERTMQQVPTNSPALVAWPA